MILGFGNAILQDKFKGMLKYGRVVIIEAQDETLDNIDACPMNLANGFFIILGLALRLIDVP
jgi:hypothetical protein